MGRNRKLIVLGVIVALLIGILAVGQIVQASSSNQPENIFGSWNVAVTTTSQNTQFPALLTFTADGSVLADEPPVPGETTGHGNWIRGSRGKVQLTFVALYADPTGTYAGKLKVSSVLQRDPGTDTWSGPFKIDIYDASNQVIFTDTGTFELTRIEVEPLD